jgi:hypothetical protein
LRIREIPHGLELAKPAEGYVRTPGLHASDLYGAFYKTFDPKRYDKRDKDGNATPMDLAKIELGLCFEQELEDLLIVMMEAMRVRMSRRLLGERPGEFTYHHDRCPGDATEFCKANCVIFSPDYLFDEGDELILGEFKCTYYSTKDAPLDPKFAKWWTQVKLYCYWLGVTKARLYVMFVCGDYKPPSPQLRAWEASFTQAELQEEFDMIARNARKKGLIAA